MGNIIPDNYREVLDRARRLAAADTPEKLRDYFRAWPPVGAPELADAPATYADQAPAGYGAARGLLGVLVGLLDRLDAATDLDHPGHADAVRAMLLDRIRPGDQAAAPDLAGVCRQLAEHTAPALDVLTGQPPGLGGQGSGSSITRAGQSVVEALAAAMAADPGLTLEDAIRTVPIGGAHITADGFGVTIYYPSGAPGPGQQPGQDPAVVPAGLPDWTPPPGLIVGPGGAGPDQAIPQCPVCLAYGGGGHGGGCPNSGRPVTEWVRPAEDDQ